MSELIRIASDHCRLFLDGALCGVWVRERIKFHRVTGQRFASLPTAQTPLPPLTNIHARYNRDAF
jgi:hypothetical protein